jgi:hypothetical protein
MMRSVNRSLQAYVCTAVLLSVSAGYSAAPVRASAAYEDTLRIAIAFHDAASICVQAGGRGSELLQFVLDALDTTRFGAVDIQYHTRSDRGEYHNFHWRGLIERMGRDSLPHVYVYISGDRNNSYYGNVTEAHFNWAGENNIGIVTVGPGGLYATFKGSLQKPFFTESLTVNYGEAPLYDARWLRYAGDSVFMRLDETLLPAATRQYYPNVNGVLRNTLEHVLPATGDNTTLYYKDFGGTGRCKVGAVTGGFADDPRSRTLCYERGFNARPDTLFTKRLDDEGGWMKSEDGEYLFDEIIQDAGFIGGPSQYHAVTVYQDTIDTVYFDNRGYARDPRVEEPVIRRAVMLNFNPAYLRNRIAAEQVLYDAILYASSTHLIGVDLPTAAPPPIEPLRMHRPIPLPYRNDTSRMDRPAFVCSLDGKTFRVESMQTVRRMKARLAAGVWFVLARDRRMLGSFVVAR